MSQAITFVQKNTARLKYFFLNICKTLRILFPCLSVQRVLVSVIWDSWGLFGTVWDCWGWNRGTWYSGWWLQPQCRVPHLNRPAQRQQRQSCPMPSKSMVNTPINQCCGVLRSGVSAFLYSGESECRRGFSTTLATHNLYPPDDSWLNGQPARTDFVTVFPKIHFQS